MTARRKRRTGLLILVAGMAAAATLGAVFTVQAVIDQEPDPIEQCIEDTRDTGLPEDFLRANCEYEQTGEGELADLLDDIERDGTP